MTLDDLRRLAVRQTLFPPTTLKRAMGRLGFVQADPIRAPARAQDLVLRHRVAGYRAGDLERRYAALGIEEDFFLNYGFVTRALHARMHPRPDGSVPANGNPPWPAEQRGRAAQLLAFVRERGAAHPREVDDHFAHGTVKNYWGGSSNATTHLLDAMHYRGMLRVARREAGIRVYAPREPEVRAIDAIEPGENATRLDALVDQVVHLQAPLPASSLAFWVRRLRFAVPQWRDAIGPALGRARERLAHARVEGVDWFWAGEAPRGASAPDDTVRLLTPFDPVVQDRTRFALLWGWEYRFEAYTPVAKRKLGYYALPILYRDRVIGWGNAALKDGALAVECGYVTGRAPRDRVFARELRGEIERMRVFLSEANPPSGALAIRPRGRGAG